jgi:hypothetical protein
MRAISVRRRRGVWGFVAVVGVLAVGLAGAGPVVAAEGRSERVSLGYVGPVIQEVVVPSWATSAHVSLWGGSGGAVYISKARNYNCLVGPSGGSLVEADISVRGERVLRFAIGQRGEYSTGTGWPPVRPDLGWGQGGWGMHTVENTFVAASGGSGHGKSNKAAAIAARASDRPIGGGGGGASAMAGAVALLTAGGGGGAGACGTRGVWVGDGGVGGSDSAGQAGQKMAAANGGHAGRFGFETGSNGTQQPDGGGGGGGGEKGGQRGGTGDDGEHEGGNGGGGAGTSWAAPGLSFTVSATTRDDDGAAIITFTE